MTSNNDNDYKPIPPERGVVTLSDASKERLRRQLLVRKADPRIPDEVWLILQECGEKAAEHLLNLLNSPTFSKRKIHEQIRVIELALLRSYGAPEGSFKRGGDGENADDPVSVERSNFIRRVAHQARLPELRPRDYAKSPKRGD